MSTHAVFPESEWRYLNRLIDDGSGEIKRQNHLAQQQLRDACADRVRNWPNTIDATRRRKLEDIAERKRQEELRRQKIDAEEADIQQQQRKKVIRDAYVTQYTTLEPIRKATSKLLLDNVLQERARQCEVNTARRQKEETDKLRWHEREVAMRRSLDDLDAAQRQAARAAAHRLRHDQLDQLESQRQQRLQEMEDLKTDRRRAQEAADCEVTEKAAEVSAKLDKAHRLQQDRHDQISAKQAARDERRRQEEDWARAREEYERAKDARAESRRQHEEAKRASVVVRRRTIAESVAQDPYSTVRVREELERRHAKEAAERFERADRLAEEKKAIRKREAELIHESRQAQLQKKKDAKERQARERAAEAESFRRNLAVLDEEEAEQRREVRREREYTQSLQRQQMEAKTRARNDETVLKRLEVDAYNEAVKEEKRTLDTYLADLVAVHSH